MNTNNQQPQSQSFTGNPGTTSNGGQDTGFAQPIDIFADVPLPEPAQQQQQPQQQQQQQQYQSPTPPAPTANPSGNGAGGGQNPLDKYVPKPDNNGEQGGKPPAKPEPPVNSAESIYKLNAGAINEQLSKWNIDYVGDITEETMQAIQQGDSGALKSLISNSVQAAASNAVYLATQLTRQAISGELSHFQATGLQEQLSNHAFDSQWKNINDDILQHPSVAKMAELKRDELRASFPNSTPEEINNMTKEFFKDFIASFSGREEQEQEQQQQQQLNPMQQFFRN